MTYTTISEIDRSCGVRATSRSLTPDSRLNLREACRLQLSNQFNCLIWHNKGVLRQWRPAWAWAAPRPSTDRKAMFSVVHIGLEETIQRWKSGVSAGDQVETLWHSIIYYSCLATCRVHSHTLTPGHGTCDPTRLFPLATTNTPVTIDCALVVNAGKLGIARKTYEPTGTVNSNGKQGPGRRSSVF